MPHINWEFFRVPTVRHRTRFLSSVSTFHSSIHPWVLKMLWISAALLFQNSFVCLYFLTSRLNSKNQCISTSDYLEYRIFSFLCKLKVCTHREHGIFKLSGIYRSVKGWWQFLLECFTMYPWFCSGFQLLRLIELVDRRKAMIFYGRKYHFWGKFSCPELMVQNLIQKQATTIMIVAIAWTICSCQQLLWNYFAYILR